ncbi:MAG TPA: acyclic terpene utilization AtuA family protein [Deltaproteobacteria bacterium]|nr:acyclic terpene utilization AtuA family protein [Deltaproteobacteria bacterium]
MVTLSRGDVTIWTEGGSPIGMGHVIRSLNIARSLRNFGVEAGFFINAEGPAAELIREGGFEYVVRPIESGDISSSARRVVIFDTKKDVSSLAVALKARGRAVVLIDNMTAADAHADAVIIPTPLADREAFKANYHGGVRFTIVGGNFIDLRKSLPERRHSLPLRVLVTMGGADPMGLTEKVVEAVKEMDRIKVTVVTGPAARPSRRLDEIREEYADKFTFLHAVKDMAPLVAGSHVAFTALGTTIWEVAYMGVPSIVIANYAEDRAGLRRLRAFGMGYALGHHEEVADEAVREALASLVDGPELWSAMSFEALGLLDGLGAARVASIIKAFVS